MSQSNEQALRPAINPEGNFMSQEKNDGIIRPTLHHFGIITGNLDEMVDWYNKVLGTTTILESSTSMGVDQNQAPVGAWLTNDRANHRIALMSLPGVSEDRDKNAHIRMQHVAFEYETINDLLNSYARMKGIGITPIASVDHGATTSFYYKDPDGNMIELQVDNFGDWDKSREYMGNSQEMMKNPLGVQVDPDLMIEAANGGASHDDLHRRALAGEFTPAQPVDPTSML
ncbi:VOC family protein [Bacillus sp. V59.32b]|uniref:VOC family protein n=1 Tax=Bacillus sp. V59.32b TaxID=1758642 RepID=UPI000E3D4B80|nr:VOC family protein [Bacillus sp. V59.32b]RFU69293.1 biphenyl-2,3-diol 1,2-dioxygenase [Bacillus sp. V59.32b]